MKKKKLEEGAKRPLSPIESITERSEGIKRERSDRYIGGYRGAKPPINPSGAKRSVYFGPEKRTERSEGVFLEILKVKRSVTTGAKRPAIYRTRKYIERSERYF